MIELPVGQFLSECLGFQGFYDILVELQKAILTPQGYQELYEYEFVPSNEDYEILKDSLKQALKEIGFQVEFKDDKVVIPELFRVSRAEVIEKLLGSRISKIVEEYFKSIQVLARKHFLIYPVTKYSGIAQRCGTMEYFRYRLSGKYPELIMNMEEQLYVLAFENILNWFIREYLKEHLNSEVYLNSIRIMEVNFRPEDSTMVEEIDELLIKAEVEIIQDNEKKRFLLETSNWIQKQLVEI